MGIPNLILDALIRIEHKLDWLIRREQQRVGMDLHMQDKILREGIPCPLCHQPTQLKVDIEEAVVHRECGCHHGKVPGIPLRDLAPAVAPRKDDEDVEGNSGEERASEGLQGDRGGSPGQAVRHGPQGPQQ